MSFTTAIEWTAKQRSLVQLERDADNHQLREKMAMMSAKACEAAGLSLLSLSIDSCTTGLFGRTTVTLVRSDGKPFPSRAFKVGYVQPLIPTSLEFFIIISNAPPLPLTLSIHCIHLNRDEVSIYSPKLKNTQKKQSSTEEDDDDEIVTGIVSKVQSSLLVVICDEIDASMYDDSIRVDIRASEHTYNKLHEILEELDRSEHPLANLLFSPIPSDVAAAQRLFHCRERLNSSHSNDSNKPCVLIDSGLNASQQQAVSAITAAKTLSLISLVQGPPGTGKTSTVIELIRQAVARNEKVLVCAPSNVAVDNILHRLAACAAGKSGSSSSSSGGGHKKSSSSLSSGGLRMVRLGHPARVNAEVLLPILLPPDSLTPLLTGHPARVNAEILLPILLPPDSLTPLLTGHPARVNAEILLQMLTLITTPLLPYYWPYFLFSESQSTHFNVHLYYFAIQVHPYCLDALIENHEGTEIIIDVKNELTQLLKKGGYRREIRQELRDLRKEVRQREDAVTKSILNSADVVLCTCITAKSRLLKGREYRSPMSLASSLASSATSSDGYDPQLQPFDLCIIDEAAQALEVR